MSDTEHSIIDIQTTDRGEYSKEVGTGEPGSKELTEKTEKLEKNITRFTESMGRRIKDTEEKLNTIIEKQNFFEDKVDKNIKDSVEKSEDKIDRKIENSKTGIIESLALFAAFFTFVAVNVQIFTKVTNLRSAMWFSLLLLGCLGFFAVIVHLIILKREYKRISILIGTLLILFSIFISLGLIFGNEKLHENESNNFKVNNNSVNTLNNDQASTSPNLK